MKKWIWLMVVVLVLVGVLPKMARADEVSELKKQLAELTQRIEQLEARQRLKEKSLEQEIARVAEQKAEAVPVLPDNIKWIENVKISGDLRYRHESIDAESGGDWDQGHNRNRIRARIGIEARVNDETDVIFRLASGSADPVSTNQTLADSFSSKELWLDLAYFDWHPASIKGFNAFGGKMANPFYRVGKNQLIWDSDLNPEGLAANYVMPFGENGKLHLNGGGFWVDESSGGVDTSLWGIQGYLKHNFQNKSYLLGGAGYFDYGNIAGRGDLKNTWNTPWDSTDPSFFGNKATGNTFDSDFDLIEAFAEYGFNAGSMPVTVYGDYVHNTVAATNEDTGWLIGCKFNKAKEPGSWEASYDYRDLEADATLGSFSDSDFKGGGTDGKGHRFGFKYQLHKNVQAALTYFLNERYSDDQDYRRLQADLIYKF
ncbi:MAG TPA: hypothetical protein HPP87_12365 [Planctomycetes bacterium]|nr:hypothetical protein [Planctomycetota bacterium]